MSDTHERFRAARRFEPDLTPRQREILALIAAGRTNTEIAATYDMTPDGAKWHVIAAGSMAALAIVAVVAAFLLLPSNSDSFTPGDPYTATAVIDGANGLAEVVLSF